MAEVDQSVVYVLYKVVEQVDSVFSVSSLFSLVKRFGSQFKAKQVEISQQDGCLQLLRFELTSRHFYIEELREEADFRGVT